MTTHSSTFSFSVETTSFSSTQFYDQPNPLKFSQYIVAWWHECEPINTSWFTNSFCQCVRKLFLREFHWLCRWKWISSFHAANWNLLLQHEREVLRILCSTSTRRQNIFWYPSVKWVIIIFLRCTWNKLTFPEPRFTAVETSFTNRYLHLPFDFSKPFFHNPGTSPANGMPSYLLHSIILGLGLCYVVFQVLNVCSTRSSR